MIFLQIGLSFFLIGITFILIIGGNKRWFKSQQVYDGELLVIISEDGPKVFSLVLDGDPEELEKKDSVTFKVGPRKAPVSNKA